MKLNQLKIIEWILRIGVFMTFFGHGIIAIQGNPYWFKYLITLGVDIMHAQNTLMIIGCLDVIVAFIILFKPNKYVIIWAFMWAFSTALIRPISGESFWQFVERGANWATPLCLYLYYRFELKSINVKLK